MGQLFIRNLDDAILVRLKRRAWEEGLPLEEFLRRLLAACASAGDEAAESGDAMGPRPPLPERAGREHQLAYS